MMIFHYFTPWYYLYLVKLHVLFLSWIMRYWQWWKYIWR
jgi:hypothetical protein